MKYNSGMARRPAIFVSSTCYDLKQIRQNIRDFVENDLGYEAVLSEYDSFPIDPDKDTIENCLRVVEQRADILILIVGGRYGCITNHGEKSITNLEYLRAKSKNIPVFVFIEQRINNILQVWERNKSGDYSGIVDSTKIFEFVADLKRNNWVHEFDSSSDIINCMRTQIAYLVNDNLQLRQHLNKENVSPKVMEYSGKVFELAVEKPRYWEYLLFTEALKDNLSRVEDLRYDLKYGISLEKIIQYTELKDIVNFVGKKCHELINRCGLLDVIINEALQEAFGAKGVPGNPEYIIYVAEKIVDIYRSCHLWSLDFKCVLVAPEFQNLIDYASELSKSVISDIEHFISDCDKQINEAILGLDTGAGKRVISITLKLSILDTTKFDGELERLTKELHQ